MKNKVKNFFFGIGQTVEQTFITITRKNLEINDTWFDNVFKKNYSDNIKSKFIPELYEEQGLSEEILEQNLNFDKLREKALNEIRILSEWLTSLVTESNNLLEIFSQEKAEVNIDSVQYQRLESFALNKDKYKDSIASLNSVISGGNIAEMSELVKLESRDFEVERGSGYFQTAVTSFIVNKPQATYEIELINRRLSEITIQIFTVNSLIDKLDTKHFFIIGNAGIGKSNLSAFLSNKIKENNFDVIFIKAKSFSGESTDFEKLFLKNLEIPWGYSFTEVLSQLNDYGKKDNKRITIVIDGLNETTYTTQGFSTIWSLHLDSFVHQLKTFPYLSLVTTFRTSYTEKIWDNNMPYLLHELVGFDNKSLTSVISKYFKYYRIDGSKLSDADIFYFRTPLLLDLYCKMLNPKREEKVDAVLGISGFKQVFEKYIDDLSNEIKQELGLISSELIEQGIGECSDVFLEELQAFIPIVKFYNLMEGKKITRATNTIGHAVLEGNLIYIRDYIKGLKKEVVQHTQQEVGGYLLSKRLLEVYTTIEGVVNSEFYQNNIVGPEENQHQLKDDILIFLITESEERNDLITQYSSQSSLKELVWAKLQREPTSISNIEFRDNLASNFSTLEEWDYLLTSSKNSLLSINSVLNFWFIKEVFIKRENFNFELTWTKHIYNNFEEFNVFLNDYLMELAISDDINNPDEEAKLKIELAIWLLESTIVNLRDIASKVILEFGSIHPEYIFDKVIEYANSGRSYIYERLALISYGICLRKQNDQKFIEEIFIKYVPLFYDLQFCDKPKSPSYDYIVIDSIKHIIDLGIHKKVFTLKKPEEDQLNNYQFFNDEEWPEITPEDEKVVSGTTPNHYTSKYLDPLSMDFIIYTIPRLFKRGVIHEVTARANIYKRLTQKGYKAIKYEKGFQKFESSFYHGETPYGASGKVERLGKKYLWIAFFEYAGHLLNNNQLRVWYQDDPTYKKHYDRLSDMEIEVSHPKLNFINEKLFTIDLLSHKSDKPDWVYVEKFDELKSVMNWNFEEGSFTLLYGLFIQKADQGYDCQSFLLVDSFLVSRSDIEGKEHEIGNRNMDWDHDLYSLSSMHNVYFGELYWADNVPVRIKKESASIPTEKEEDIEYKLDFEDILNYKEYQNKKAGDIVGRTEKVHVSFECEAALIEYAWESDSMIFPSLRDFIPTPEIGRFLKLKSDPANFQILDINGDIAIKTIRYKGSDFTEQKINYFRTDLLNKYMEENDLVLMYQIKQHTYDRKAGDGSGDFRGMKFIFPHIKTT